MIHKNLENISKTFYTTIEEREKYGDLLKKRIIINVKDVKISFTFDLARRGILFLTAQDNVNSWISEIKDQLCNNSSGISVFFCENNKLYTDCNVIKIKKQEQFVDFLNSVDKPFVIIWHKQKNNKFNYALFLRKYLFALFVVTSVEEMKEFYVTNIVDRIVFNSKLFKENKKEWDIIFDNNSIITKSVYSYETGNNALIIV